jgi:hypothetical protein
MSDSKDYIEIDDSIFDELEEMFEDKIKELKQD